MTEAAVLVLQRALVEAALTPDSGPLEGGPGGFAARQGLPPGDQAAFCRFKDRLLLYRNLVRANLVEPVEWVCRVTRALLQPARAWDDCMAAFLASRGIQSAFYRDVSTTFLGWLAASGWGHERWPFLLQLVHFELLTALVARHPGGALPGDLHPLPRLVDVLVLDLPSQVVTYRYHVHRATPETPVPDPGEVHLLAYRDVEGDSRWIELTPAAAALLVGARDASIGQTALDLGLEDLSATMELLADLQAKGAIRGFRASRLPPVPLLPARWDA
jgi:hypothetical protein